MSSLNSFAEATRGYDDWLRTQTEVIESEIRDKHQRMKKDVLAFLRGTFYRWSQVFPETCKDLNDAPVVIACGDLHIGSFGTWRDAEGRLCWGVDDFDEAYPLPYTNDLVRLATSVKLLLENGDLNMKLREACDCILEGYAHTVKAGGCPIVLAEREDHLEQLGVDELKPPPRFWISLNRHPALKKGVPSSAREALTNSLPAPGLKHKIVRREAGMGSLGRQRFVVLAEWQGGFVAREVKAMVPSACAWRDGRKAALHIKARKGANSADRTKHGGLSYYNELMCSAVRCRDPFQRVDGHWLIRRLSPDSNPIDLDSLPAERDEETLLHAMGTEAANLHLGSDGCANLIDRDLHRRGSKWLRRAAKEMARQLKSEWHAQGGNRG